MVVVPAESPLTVPAVTEATVVLLLLHTPPGVVQARVVLLPVQTVAVPVMGATATGAFTVALTVDATVPQALVTA